MSSLKFYSTWFVSLLALVLAFSGIDYFFHLISPNWAVPEYYFKNKIIWGFLWSIPAAYVALKFSKIWQKSLSFSAVISIILQARYYWEGYPLDFVLIFLGIHFAILFVLSLGMFKIYQRKTHPNPPLSRRE